MSEAPRHVSLFLMANHTRAARSLWQPHAAVPKRPTSAINLTMGQNQEDRLGHRKLYFTQHSFNRMCTFICRPPPRQDAQLALAI